MQRFNLNQNQIKAYQSDGAVLKKGLFSDWVDEISAGIERNNRKPYEYAAENVTDTDAGRVFDD